jgi:hypothetical protein
MRGTIARSVAMGGRRLVDMAEVLEIMYPSKYVNGLLGVALSVLHTET